MIQTFVNIFKIPELRWKILFTLGMLCIYRVGWSIPLPGVDQEAMKSAMSRGGDQGPMSKAADYLQLFTGGTLSQSSLFGLGIMPYISASIIFQLLGTVVPALEKLQKEGQVGRKKIQEYTRYATVGLCLIQSIGLIFWMRGSGFVQPEIVENHFGMFFFMGIIAMTTGTIFLMWLGEQIDEYGIGNGISLIIMAGIVAAMPGAMVTVFRQFDNYGLAKILILVAAFVSVVAGAILITQGQRRIPIQQARMMRGRRAYGGSRQYLPLRVNHGGVMPIIFASTLMIFPQMMLSWMAQRFQSGFVSSLNEALNNTSFVYNFLYILMIYFFAYFWTTVQFQPKEMANNLRDSGSFIPGLRPGKRTAEYLEKVMSRITYVGAAFLAAISVIPTMIMLWMQVEPQVALLLGGTGLLITVSVSLDLVQRIEANLTMRNYGGFMEGGGRIKGSRS